MRPSGPVVSAYIPTANSRRALRDLERSLAAARREGLIRAARRSTAIVRADEWSSSWKRYFRPAKIADGLYIVPSWRRDFQPPRGARVIELDPGMAFGTGQHPTTKMALQLMLPLVRKNKPMLDVGCGSGILGIAAAQLGARVFACDDDPAAAHAARANFRANGLHPMAIKRSAWSAGQFPRAQVIAANITADVLAPLARDFARSLQAGGALITSGITARGRANLLEEFSRAGLRLVNERRSGEWFAFVHAKAGY